MRNTNALPDYIVNDRDCLCFAFHDGSSEVDEGCIDALINYLRFGFSPGSFLTNVLLNNFSGAMSSCHPSNSTRMLKTLSYWVDEVVPAECKGTNIGSWVSLTDEDRRVILENYGLVRNIMDIVRLT